MAKEDRDVTQNRSDNSDHNWWRHARPIPETPAEAPGKHIPTPHQPFQYYEPRNSRTTSLDTPRDETYRQAWQGWNEAVGHVREAISLFDDPSSAWGGVSGKPETNLRIADLDPLAPVVSRGPDAGQ